LYFQATRGYATTVIITRCWTGYRILVWTKD